MYTSTDLLKEYIYDRVSDIKDENVLLAIKTLVDNLRIAEDNITEKVDYNKYMKEWLKDMN